MPVIWIASECRGKEKLEYLKQTIESCLAVPTTRKIVLSIHTDNILPFFDERVIVKERKTCISQFYHLSLLAVEEKEDSEEWITFMDDDDLLFSSIVPYYNHGSAFRSLQIIACAEDGKAVNGLSESVTPSDIPSILTNDYLLRDEDFSGCSCRFSLVQEYFSSRVINKYIEPLEDTRFMQFLEDKGGKLSFEPLVFHRVFPSSVWRNTLLQKYARITGENKPNTERTIIS